MDSESLTQIERIVTAVTEGLRQDIVALRQSTEATAGELRQDIVGLRPSQEATAVGLRNEVTTTADEIKRHTGVLIEGLRHDIQSFAEGFQMHLDRRHAEDRDYMDREFRELRALLKLSCAQLHDRVEALDHRGSRLEYYLGLSE